MRISVDIGGTFTDLVLESDDGQLQIGKAPTVPDDPVRGIEDVLADTARLRGTSVGELLAGTDTFVHATTRGLNAVLTGATARTAFLTTRGHPDVLLLREGGREDPFDFTVAYPEPYVPRSLTFEVPGRITASGAELEPLDVTGLDHVIDRVAAADVEAIGVCLLWSTVNPAHELAVGARLAERLPDVPHTLSHTLNPSLREYRRASSACIDASLKPLMTHYLRDLDQRLRSAGFAGRLLVVTSSGGVVDVEDVAAAPILSINSGPSMAPVAGRAYASADLDVSDGTAIVADAGGTTYDVTLVRAGQIPWTRSAWVGPRFTGHMTGLPSIDVKSVGAGGGSIVWVDPGGLLHVGPQSAGSVPGPACYGRGGTDATVTDAAVVLGYLDPAAFSGGSMPLDPEAARAAVRGAVAEPLGLDEIAAAAAIMRLTTEQMVRAIEEITLEQGIDPAGSVLVGGGGAAGLNAVAVAQRLGCRRLVIPAVGAALAAAGALMSDLTANFAATVPTTSDAFDTAAVNQALASLEERGTEFIARAGTGSSSTHLYAEARYPQQIWELEVPVRAGRFRWAADVERFVEDFHQVHEQVLGIADRSSPVEVVGWGARVRCPLRGEAHTLAAHLPAGSVARPERDAYVDQLGVVPTPVRALGAIGEEEVVQGPVIIESAFTTVVVLKGSSGRRTPAGSLVVSIG